MPKCIIAKHKKLIVNSNEIKWSVEKHFHEKGYSFCGQSCICCRAQVQKETGEIQLGACTICLNH